MEFLGSGNFNMYFDYAFIALRYRFFFAFEKVDTQTQWMDAFQRNEWKKVKNEKKKLESNYNFNKGDLSEVFLFNCELQIKMLNSQRKGKYFHLISIVIGFATLARTMSE